MEKSSQMMAGRDHRVYLVRPVQLTCTRMMALHINIMDKGGCRGSRSGTAVLGDYATMMTMTIMTAKYHKLVLAIIRAKEGSGRR